MFYEVLESWRDSELYLKVGSLEYGTSRQCLFTVKQGHKATSTEDGSG